MIYSTTDPDEQLHYFNVLFTECLERHAPLRLVRVIGPSSPWMKCDEILHLQHERDKLRKLAHSSNAEKDWDLFRAIRNKLKTAIRHSRSVFISNLKLSHLKNRKKYGKLFIGSYILVNIPYDKTQNS